MRYHGNLGNKGISMVTLVITIIVVIIIISITIFMGIKLPDRANLARFISEFSDFQSAVRHDYVERSIEYSKNDQSRTKSQKYYIIASGNDMGMYMPTAPKGFVSDLGTILPEGLKGDEYYLITSDTNINRLE